MSAIAISIGEKNSITAASKRRNTYSASGEREILPLQMNNMLCIPDISVHNNGSHLKLRINIFRIENHSKFQKLRKVSKNKNNTQLIFNPDISQE